MIGLLSAPEKDRAACARSAKKTSWHEQAGWTTASKLKQLFVRKLKSKQRKFLKRYRTCWSNTFSKQMKLNR
jgi:hypothetical protein